MQLRTPRTSCTCMQASGWPRWWPNSDVRQQYVCILFKLPRRRPPWEPSRRRLLLSLFFSPSCLLPHQCWYPPPPASQTNTKPAKEGISTAANPNDRLTGGCVSGLTRTSVVCTSSFAPSSTTVVTIWCFCFGVDWTSSAPSSGSSLAGGDGLPRPAGETADADDVRCGGTVTQRENWVS